jgi:hypothetical protein
MKAVLSVLAKAARPTLNSTCHRTARSVLSDSMAAGGICHGKADFVGLAGTYRARGGNWPIAPLHGGSVRGCRLDGGAHSGALHGDPVGRAGQAGPSRRLWQTWPLVHGSFSCLSLGKRKCNSLCRLVMPFKHNSARRHRIEKMNFRVTNWPEYEAGLRRRGSLTLWADTRMPCPRGKHQDARPGAASTAIPIWRSRPP